MKLGDILDSNDQRDDNFGSSDDIRQAIENLSSEDVARIRKAAKYCLFGTEYQDPSELVNEAVIRSIEGANGFDGRRWPKNIPFVAFMFKTIQSIANGSRESPIQGKTVRLEAMTAESQNVDNALASFDYFNVCVVSQAIEVEEIEDRITNATTDTNLIDTYFGSDDEVSWIIMGYKDGMKASEIRNISGMTTKEYETAHKRFRRGLDKLFPGRRNT